MCVDFHSHILPCIDDGSRSVEESIAMLRMSAEQGIREVILTPHFYAQHTTPQRFLEKREQACVLLEESWRAEPELPDLRCGAEVYYFPQMSYSDALRELTIEGTDCILVEMPMGRWTEQMYRELESINRNLGLTPIIAHVDRYLGRLRDYGIPERLAELPVMVQANASFFLEGTKGLRLLREHRIHLLGSDCHNMVNRKPNLGPAIERIEKKLGADAVDWIRHQEHTVLHRQYPDPQKNEYMRS